MLVLCWYSFVQLALLIPLSQSRKVNLLRQTWRLIQICRLYSSKVVHNIGLNLPRRVNSSWIYIILKSDTVKAELESKLIVSTGCFSRFFFGLALDWYMDWMFLGHCKASGEVLESVFEWIDVLLVFPQLLLLMCSEISVKHEVQHSKKGYTWKICFKKTPLNGTTYTLWPERLLEDPGMI